MILNFKFERIFHPELERTGSRMLLHLCTLTHEMVAVRVDESHFSLSLLLFRFLCEIFVVNVIIMTNAIHRKLNERFCSFARAIQFLFRFTIVAPLAYTQERNIRYVYVYVYKKTCLFYLFTCKSVFDTH